MKKGEHCERRVFEATSVSEEMNFKTEDCFYHLNIVFYLC